VEIVEQPRGYLQLAKTRLDDVQVHGGVGYHSVKRPKRPLGAVPSQPPGDTAFESQLTPDP
jgi:hypothetical protein